jgi:hypothetical protein
LSRTTQTFSQAVYGHIKRKGYNKVVFIEKTLLWFIVKLNATGKMHVKK